MRVITSSGSLSYCVKGHEGALDLDQAKAQQEALIICHTATNCLT